jgi:hypothetical protein
MPDTCFFNFTLKAFYAIAYFFVSSLANLFHNKQTLFRRYLLNSANNCHRLDSGHDMGGLRLGAVQD